MSYLAYTPQILGYWYSGLWGLLSFTMQMVMILVLGHMIALSPLVTRFIYWFVALFKNMSLATVAALVTTLSVAFFNWGLGLIFGAVIARKLGEYATDKNLPFNYPLITAAGYSGLMIWHGGISGSAPLTVAKEGHFLFDEIGIVSSSVTIFSTQNLIASLLIIAVLGAFTFFQSKRHRLPEASWKLDKASQSKDVDTQVSFLVMGFAMMMLLVAGWKFVSAWTASNDFFAALNLDFINFMLFGLALLLLGNVKRIEKAIGEASSSAAGILIQFPLYAGIMAIMRESGMITLLADGFIAISTERTYPIFTMLSAALVNLVVPSGGGQWAVQGPVVVEAAQSLNVSIPKSIMALAYGDQLTNMIQPFWALPLLGITRIKASQLLPYTFWFMVLGVVVYGLILLLW